MLEIAVITVMLVIAVIGASMSEPHIDELNR